MRKFCGTFNCSTQINVSILVLGNFDVRYKNKNYLFFVESELCIVPKSLWVLDLGTVCLGSLQQVKLSHIQIVQWSIFLFNTQVTFTVLISSFDLKKEWKFTAFLGPEKISSEDFRANYRLKLCVSWNKRHPGKKGKIFENVCIGMKYVIFYWKFSFTLIMLGTILYISRVIKINWKLVLSTVKVLLGGEV